MDPLKSGLKINREMDRRSGQDGTQAIAKAKKGMNGSPKVSTGKVARSSGKKRSNSTFADWQGV